MPAPPSSSPSVPGPGGSPAAGAEPWPPSPPAPAFTTSFKSVLPPLRVRDYRRIQFDQLDKWKFYAYMPISSFAVRCLSHPLAVIKTRMQTYGSTVASSAAFPSTASPYSAAAAASAAASAKPTASGALVPPRIIPYRPLPVDLSRKTTFGAIKHVLEYEGFRGLYSGFGVAVLGLVVGPIYITSLETARAALYQSGIQHNMPIDVVPFLAGAAASCASQVIGVPLDVVSNRQMKGQRHRRKWAHEIMRDVHRTQGFSGFYKGYWLTLMHNAPMSALVWFSFAQIHPRLSRLLPPALVQWTNVSTQSSPTPPQHISVSPAAAPSLTPSAAIAATAVTPSSSTVTLSSTVASASSAHHHAGHHKWNVAELSVVFVSAAISGGFASMMTLPLDVLKTRLQTSSRADATFKNTWNELMRERGWKGLMAGYRPRLVAAASTSAAMMTIYEILKRVCVLEHTMTDHRHEHH